MTGKRNISWFITPHGFGHAARAAAVMGAVHKTDPGVRFEIFTSVPEFFFRESMKPGTFTYHYLETDIGLAQKSALVSDIPETVRRLDAFLPLDEQKISDLGEKIQWLNSGLMVCDIAPMGIAVAKAAGIPSLLMENFTWDWIYEQYSGDTPAINPHIAYLRELFASADHHIQAEPVCFKQKGAFTTPPVSREPVTPRRVIREQLKIPIEVPVVMISMGGVSEDLPFVRELSMHKDFWFLIPGSPSLASAGHMIRLPHDSGFFHPDLINASDVVIGKPGYSTLAEVYRAGVPLGSVSRPDFRESRVMESFIEREMKGLLIQEKEYREGRWLERLPELLAMPRIQRTEPNGAETAARFILSLL
ncbi:MAG: UDP-N-acetylglucosamine--N-acetylmuramyl-(pentapeptide) pyrophosphoryl-undecaprenol N-acetylglucosamine transferase [bacterium]|nr:UDP-N-acetylglucosamine--N-acetylmuramyl-(pentapeptide) pyrophosphoryl-undecaprenol N-acetylglucosamine transferase [bacterium]